MARFKTLYQANKQIIRYLIAGVLTTIVCFVVYLCCVKTVLDPGVPLQLQAANAISWVAAVTFAYAVNRRFVFESRDPHILREAAAFYAARIGTLLLEMAFMYLTVSRGGMNDRAAKVLAQIIVIIANYLFSKWFVFRRGDSSREPGEQSGGDRQARQRTGRE